MSLHSKKSISSLNSASELSLESFNLEPGAPDRQKSGFFSGLWRAVGRATEVAVALPFAQPQGTSRSGTNDVSTGSSPTRSVPVPIPSVDSGHLHAHDVSVAGSTGFSSDSDLASETGSQASSYQGSSHRLALGTTDDVEKNKSSLKLIRRIRNIGSTGITKDYWMRDDKVKECYDCKQPFTTFRRKHHCRICGELNQVVRSESNRNLKWDRSVLKARYSAIDVPHQLCLENALDILGKCKTGQLCGGVIYRPILIARLLGASVISA